MRRTKLQPRFRLATEGTRKGRASKENGMKKRGCLRNIARKEKMFFD